MPIYEFSCLHCGNEFERIQAFSDTSLSVCPVCHGHRVQRRMSSPAIHFKGSGWYVTDSKNASKTGATGKNSADKGESAATEAGKSESGKSESGKSESGKSESGKSESGKSESGKSESGKSESGKRDGPTPVASAPSGSSARSD